MTHQHTVLVPIEDYERLTSRAERLESFVNQLTWVVKHPSPKPNQYTRFETLLAVCNEARKVLNMQEVP